MKLSVAILDLYKGEPNQGMRNIHDLLERYALENNVQLTKTVYDVRGAHAIPELDYDLFVSTGGPGSPVDKEGWEEQYMMLMHNIITHNASNERKKFVFLICHSFQVVCHYLNFGKVCMRRSESFGIFPMHKTHYALGHPMMDKLNEPFYAVDSRKWQVIEINHAEMERMNSKILALEKIRPHVDLERATMAIQFTPEIFGTQFHPEADQQGMIYYLTNEEKKSVVIENYGMEKYNEMMEHLNDPDKISFTRSVVIPSFMDEVMKNKMLAMQTL